MATFYKKIKKDTAFNTVKKRHIGAMPKVVRNRNPDKQTNRNTDTEGTLKKDISTSQNNIKAVQTGRILGRSKDHSFGLKKSSKFLSFDNTDMKSGELKSNKQKYMKNRLKQEHINKLVRSGYLKKKTKLTGMSGVQKVLRIAGMMISGVIKAMGNVIFSALSLFAPLIIVCFVVVIFLLTIAGGAEAEDITSYVAGADSSSESVVPGSVSIVRTSLTYAEVHSIPWYSSKSPFSGDIGLDKLSGDRGGNCTAYAWGRRCELEGKRTQLGTYGNACTWYDREVAAGIYKCGQTAKVGAVCCWSYNAEGGNPGHVAVIEKINTDGSIVVSNSAYGSGTGRPILFYLTTYGSETELKSAFYKFNGYIYMEKVGGDEESEENTSNAEGGKDKVK